MSNAELIAEARRQAQSPWDEPWNDTLRDLAAALEAAERIMNGYDRTPAEARAHAAEAERDLLAAQVGRLTGALEAATKNAERRERRETKAQARADKWLDRTQRLVTMLSPETIGAAHSWAIAMKATDVPKAMSDWLLDSENFIRSCVAGVEVTDDMVRVGATAGLDAVQPTWRATGSEPSPDDLNFTRAALSAALGGGTND